MNPDAFMGDFSRDEETDKLYAVLGRALTLATRFEDKCESLAKLVALRQNSKIYAEPFETRVKFVKKIEEKTLGQHIRKFLPSFEQIPDISIEELFKRAREARNEIAHKVALGVEHTFADPQDRGTFFGHLTVLVQAVAIGDRIASIALSDLNGDPIPTAEFLSKYHENVAEWVVTL